MPTDDIALPDGHVRITPAQRDRALAALRDAAADERLRFEELEARSDAVLRASTRDDLASVLYDLLPGAALEATVSDLLPVSSAPGMSWDTPLLFEGEHWWKTRQIRGEWDVPPFIEVVASQGSVLLDFLQARPPESRDRHDADLVVAGRAHSGRAAWVGRRRDLVPVGDELGEHRHPDPAAGGPPQDRGARLGGRVVQRPLCDDARAPQGGPGRLNATGV